MKYLEKFDKYVLSEFWLPLISGAGIITGVWLGIDKFKEIFKLLARSGASFTTGLVILGLEIPQILSLTIPISILLASFLAFQKLSGQSEVIALRAAGLSFTRLMRPVIILGLLGLLLTFALSEFIVPITTPFAKKIYTLALYQDPIATSALKGFSYFEKDSTGTLKRIFYVRRFHQDQLKNIVILDFSKNNLSVIHTAKIGYWDAAKGGWFLKNGSTSYVKEFDANKDHEVFEDDFDNQIQSSSTHLISNFKETFIPSSLNPQEILKKIANVKDMNFAQLLGFIKLHQDAHLETDSLDEYKTKFHSKFSYPASCIVLAIIGACLGIVGRRRTINWGYILLGLIVFVFYMSQTVFESFGNSGKLLPFVSVWIPNLIMAWIAAGVFFYRANK
jgi:lipopolysaccharide export system permease protein